MSAERTADDCVIDELFGEQENPVFSLNYRYGVLRSIYVVGRSLLSPRSAVDAATAIEQIRLHRRLAIVFFENEFQAASRARALGLVDGVLRLDLTALSVIRQQLGFAGTLRQIVYFGWRSVHSGRSGLWSRFSIPLLGWLLYQAFGRLLAHNRDIQVVTANIQHPASIGVHRAAKALSCRTAYLEHATTSSLGFCDRGYDQLFVNFPHTMEMLSAKGVAAERILVTGTAPSTLAWAWDPRFRKAAFCINDLDTMAAVEHVTAVLQERGYELTYRIHDSDVRFGAFQAMAQKQGIAISSARESRIADFLPSVDFVVAGNSNVIADCLQHGKPAIYYWEGAAELFDYYGLIAYYDIPHATSPQALRLLLDDVMRTQHLVQISAG